MDRIIFTSSIMENQRLIGICFSENRVIYGTTAAEDIKYTIFYKIVGVDKEYVSCLAFDNLLGYSYDDFNDRTIVNELSGSFRIINVPIYYFNDVQYNLIPLEKYAEEAHNHVNVLINMEFEKYRKTKWEKEQEEYLDIIESGDPEKIIEYHDKKYPNGILEEEISDELKDEIKDIIIEQFNDIDEMF